MSNYYSLEFTNRAHKHTFQNEAEIRRSSRVVCCFCGSLYDPHKEEMDCFEDREARTYACSRCGVDAVLGDASGFPMDDLQFVRACCADWFAGREIKFLRTDM